MKNILVVPSVEPTEPQIQHTAYLLWVEAGRPAGRDVEHWHAAQEFLRHRSAGSAVPAKRRRSRPEAHLAR